MKKLMSAFSVFLLLFSVSCSHLMRSSEKEYKFMYRATPQTKLPMLLDDYEKASGLTIVRSVEPPVRYCYLQSYIKLTKAEYLDGLKTYIEMNGITLEQGEGNSLRVVLASKEDIKTRNSVSTELSKPKRNRTKEYLPEALVGMCDYSGNPGTLGLMLDDYCEKTGLVALRSPRVRYGVEVEAYKTTKALTLDEYLDAIETFLKSNGIVLEGYKDRFVKVLPAPKNK